MLQRRSIDSQSVSCRKARSIRVDARSRLRDVRELLLAWYGRCGRDLPWRHTQDPYPILVSEVMLQQTQVERVIPRWHAWLARWPTVESLAATSTADVILQWQGVGANPPAGKPPPP